MSDTDTDQDIDLEKYEEENRALVDKILESPDGVCKNASTASDVMIRRRIRENAFGRRIIPPKTIGNSELDRSKDTDLPIVIEDMEADTAGAKSLSFDESPDTELFRGDKFIVIFHKVSTPWYTISTDRLRTYKMDVRKVTIDNGLKDIQTEEDVTLVDTFDEIVGAATGNGAAGVNQHVQVNGDLTRATYVPQINNLPDRYINNGVFLMNRHTASRLLAFERPEWGGDGSEKMWENGLEGLAQAKILGIRHLFTIKNDVVPNGYVYQFAEPGYLGRFYILQDVTMYVEKKVDILRMMAHEKIGVTVANVAGVNLVRYTAIP